MFRGEIPVVIPAYKPGEPLVALISALIRSGVDAIIVVNDGSGPKFRDCFRKIAALREVSVVDHAVNLGKGAALKTGLNHALVRYPKCIGVVTADADGQHHADDIIRILEKLRENRSALVLGVRSFSSRVPWRSRVGNTVTRALMHVIVGQKLSDTQTGLRGIPSFLIPHLLRLPASGYEFELDMLVACKHQGCQLIEVPVQTIYLDNNKSSHFHPLFDSMRIYFVLLRFGALSSITALLDNLIFVFAYRATGSIGQSQVAARCFAMVFNYLGARNLVFHSQQRHTVVLPKYVLLVFANGLVSYMFIHVLNFQVGLDAIASKLLAEGLLFVVNFVIQRDLVFTRTSGQSMKQSTDWDKYYKSVPFTARVTRKYSASVLLDAIERHAVLKSDGEKLSIVEMGGANSCFMGSILARFKCRSYCVIDTNKHGLSLLEKRARSNSVIRLHHESVLELSMNMEADLVFSVGLIEHFDPDETRKAVLAHFDVLRPGGVAVISFPTPTLLYRATRGLIQALGMWKFPDERPLETSEVLAAIRERGEILHQKTLWPLLLTQHMIVARKAATAVCSEPETLRQASYADTADEASMK